MRPPSPDASILEELPKLHYGPPSGFHSLSADSPAPKLVGFFHPTATSRVPYPFRGFSLCTAVLPRRQHRAPLPLVPRMLTDRGQLPHPKPSTSRLCSVQRCVPPVWCYPPLWPLPSSGSRSPRPSSSADVPGLPENKRSWRSRAPLRRALLDHLQRLVIEGPGRSVTRTSSLPELSSLASFSFEKPTCVRLPVRL